MTTRKLDTSALIRIMDERTESLELLRAIASDQITLAGTERLGDASRWLFVAKEAQAAQEAINQLYDHARATEATD